jgi:hypothetical protein
MDKYVNTFTKSPNCNINALFDCCRERGVNYNIQNKEDFEDVKNTNAGSIHIYYAKKDGGKADAGSQTDKLSPMTAAWLGYIKGNLGAQYPDVLKNFQWGITNRC